MKTKMSAIFRTQVLSETGTLKHLTFHIKVIIEMTLSEIVNHLLDVS